MYEDSVNMHVIKTIARADYKESKKERKKKLTTSRDMKPFLATNIQTKAAQVRINVNNMLMR